MILDYMSFTFIDILIIAISVSLFLLTIRFGDNIIALFTKKH